MPTSSECKSIPNKNPVRSRLQRQLCSFQFWQIWLYRNYWVSVLSYRRKVSRRKEHKILSGLCLLPVSCWAYPSTVKMEAIYPSKCLVNSELYGLISQKIVLFYTCIASVTLYTGEGWNCIPAARFPVRMRGRRISIGVNITRGYN
jgi:hypothetical protein